MWWALAVLERAGERARATRPAVAVRIAYTASTPTRCCRCGRRTGATPRRRGRGATAAGAAACEDLVRRDADLALVATSPGRPVVARGATANRVAVFMAAITPWPPEQRALDDRAAGRSGRARRPVAGSARPAGRAVRDPWLQSGARGVPRLDDRSCCSRTSPAGRPGVPRTRAIATSHGRAWWRCRSRPGRHQRGERGVAR